MKFLFYRLEIDRVCLFVCRYVCVCVCVVFVCYMYVCVCSVLKVLFAGVHAFRCLYVYVCMGVFMLRSLSSSLVCFVRVRAVCE